MSDNLVVVAGIYGLEDCCSFEKNEEIDIITTKSIMTTISRFIIRKMVRTIYIYMGIIEAKCWCISSQTENKKQDGKQGEAVV